MFCAVLSVSDNALFENRNFLQEEFSAVVPFSKTWKVNAVSHSELADALRVVCNALLVLYTRIVCACKASASSERLTARIFQVLQK